MLYAPVVANRAIQPISEISAMASPTKPRMMPVSQRPFAAVVLGYLAITLPSAWLIRVLENRVAIVR